MPDTSPSVAGRTVEESARTGEAGALPAPFGPVVAALAGLAGGWLAAGSAGILAHSLRHALTWLAMGVALIAAWPPRGRGWPSIAALIAGLAAAVAMTASPLPSINVMAVALLLAALAAVQAGPSRRILVLASAAVATLGVYQLAMASIAVFWLGASTLARLMGYAAGHLTGEPLHVGATFGGLDFLVAMLALYAGWLAATPAPRRRRAAYGLAAILAGHLAYLIILSFGALLRGLLPEPPPPKPYHFATDPSAWTIALAIRTLVPWNLPALGALVNLAIAGCMFRWVRWNDRSAEPRRAEADAPLVARHSAFGIRHLRSAPGLLTAGAALVALLLPLATVLSTGTASLANKKVVAYEKGFLNWLKPTHGEYGRLTIGMYGMMPTYVESLGGTFRISPDLSDDDLRDANIVILMYPNTPWKEGQLERMWDVARRGGSILVFSDHTIREPQDGGNRANDVLAPTGMRIRFDTAEFEVGGWLHSYEPIAHPSTTGLRDDRNQFGVVIGASVAIRWPAYPLLMGRWGWADDGDPGSRAALLGNRRYDAGEKLGDIVLAAEQPFGKGRVIAFGDTSSMTNGIEMGAHVFTSRLLAYAAGGLTTPQALPRQLLGLLAAIALAVLLIWRAQPGRVALAALLFSASLAACTALTYRATEVLPDGTRKTPNNLAYIDTTHIEGDTSESERPDGVLGLKLTLMRNGYLALDLPEFTAERLSRAALLVSVAPAREFSRSERGIVQDFVKKGGIFISTVGWENERPSRALLADFGLYVGYPPFGGDAPAPAKGPATEYFRPPDGKPGATDDPQYAPQPLGHFKSPYLNQGTYMCFVRFHAAWPVACSEPGAAKPLAYGHVGPAKGGADVPVIIERDFGRGKVVLVGDYAFAMNKNLENMDGSPFEGMRENADFWRWFITYLTKPQSEWWTPPRPQPKGAVPPPGEE